MAIFIKYEFWGNCLKELNRRGIPVYIISAIFRPEQLFFQWYGKPYRSILKYFKHIFVQDDRSEELLKEFGFENVSVCGDTRFDRVIDINRQAKEIPEVKSMISENDEVLVAGSTWPQDEQIIIPYFNERPSMKLVIAPHEIHEEHLRSIESRIKRPFVRFSEVKKNPDAIKGKDCLIIDNFGLLSSIYRYGDIAYVGGGFGVGIHNTLEAAVYGIPVLFGPNHKRFKEACDLISQGGAYTISSDKEYVEVMNRLLSSPEMLKETGDKAKDFVYSKAGVTDKILKEINIDILG
jgi:3-deoxy-D-manno-octulosonic-acid transferase